jgi:hypothetical protein
LDVVEPGACRIPRGMVVHEDESISRLGDYRPKNVPRISQRLVDAPFGDFNGRAVAVARVQQNDGQNLFEKLHIRAESRSREGGASLGVAGVAGVQEFRSYRMMQLHRCFATFIDDGS